MFYLETYFYIPYITPIYHTQLEIAINVPDKNYTSDAEHSLLELHDKCEPSQSCTFIPEEDYHPTTAEQIEHFVVSC